MNIESLRTYCLNKKGANESFPFDDKTLVMKVMDKMFCAFNIDNFETINLKCKPELSIELRDRYQAIIPGYHMNKEHWNTIYINQDVSDQMIYELIDMSYELVTVNLPKKQKAYLDGFIE